MSKQLDARSRKPYYWPRLVIYVVILILLYQFFTSFSASPMSLQSKNEKLPWYKHHHPRLPQYNPYATTNLTTQEREALTSQMVERASQLVSRAFPEMENKIIGSSLSQDEVVQFRSLVDCWTSTGKWVRMDGEVKVMSHYQDSLYGKCDRKHRGEGQREALRYVWQSKCAPIKDNMDNSVNEDRWCEVLRGRHLLVVGDLVQYQLHEIFLDAFRDGPTVCFGELNCREHTLCAEPHRESHLKYLRNDLLSINRKMNLNHGRPKVDMIEMPFATPSLGRSYPVFILNRSPVRETDEAFITGLIATMKEIRKNNANTLVIYRSSSIGHPFCDDASGPIESLTDDEYKLLPYGWSEIKRRNAIAKAIIEGAGGVYVDLGALTDLRPDGHVGGQDCLRYCIPGPLDSWIHVLYQVFLALDGQISL
ncbi:hypothetical protein G6F55_008841 [Rhizopus delemar]|uniref:Uncharacterized protein n=2 Tax=Rhizopus TaxID=4842 RepID=A0A9P6YU21_9FUNG|nr:hypothetical protein G6F55_008841 [Rhizopus delemar]KAG1538145.1 hypothetical protein G6F51_009948 [Rhizopus arrhizus]KAG1501273.1 hypothetical protein G6F54_003157 [Rhizopus delemar]KAG1502631.1 hypothetical protein G6F53_010811 [Rhizopus delemar]KAG1524457.1 hypothetical protein G6F52_004179 [Rhizopus delemar]